MTVVADTSWLYALFDADDAHHAKARSEAQDPTPIEVPPLIAKEFLDLARKRHGKSVALGLLADLRRMPHLRLIDDARLDTTFAVWKGKAISLADANAIAWAVHRGATLRTFDARQRAALKEA
jgi:predicted nucleic acid-binding protein